MRTVRHTEQCDTRIAQDNEMVVAMFDHRFETCAIYRQGVEDPVWILGMEAVCASPWTYPQLLKVRTSSARFARTGGSWHSGSTTV